MPKNQLEQSLDRLDEFKTNFGGVGARKIHALLNRLLRVTVNDAETIIRLHELLLFIRAHPHNSSVMKKADALLRTFPQRIAQLLDDDVDLSLLEHPEVSGVAGMSVTDTFTYPIVRWLTTRNPGQLSFYWEWFEDENRIGEVWPKFMPLLEEDTLVEANIPYRQWLHNARGRRSEVTWLVDEISKSEISEAQKATLYNSQKLYVSWRYSYRDSRTGMRGPARKAFFHDGPMIQRRDVRLPEELAKRSPALERLSVAEGRKAIDAARAASTVRYRELYGFTNGDSRSVYRTSAGRGVELILIALPPECRLPLRAYHSAMIYKNGVPIGYFEGLSIFERMESGFNLYYTFREGETAWLYAQVLNVMRHLTGVSSFALDPYQIGFENEEGIQSGAFWFYRKLGFRSTNHSVRTLTEKEEEKITARKDYRTSVTTLRRLAAAPMILELNTRRNGDWDHFQVRNIGFAVQREMARKFAGNSQQMKANSVASIGTLIGIDSATFSDSQKKAFEQLAVVLSLIPDINEWSDQHKKLLERIIRAKINSSESRYLRLMQKHERLRKEMIKLGSNRQSAGEPQ